VLGAPYHHFSLHIGDMMGVVKCRRRVAAAVLAALLFAAAVGKCTVPKDQLLFRSLVLFFMRVFASFLRFSPWLLLDLIRFKRCVSLVRLVKLTSSILTLFYTFP
jgi:hypothetical protein